MKNIGLLLTAGSTDGFSEKEPDKEGKIRLLAVIEALIMKHIDMIVITGGVRDKNGDSIAKIYYRFLCRYLGADTKIAVCETGIETGSDIQAVVEKFGKGWRYIVFTSGYHVPRCQEIMARLNVNFNVVEVETKFLSKWKKNKGLRNLTRHLLNSIFNPVFMTHMTVRELLIRMVLKLDDIPPVKSYKPGSRLITYLATRIRTHRTHKK